MRSTSLARSASGPELVVRKGTEESDLAWQATYAKAKASCQLNSTRLNWEDGFHSSRSPPPPLSVSPSGKVVTAKLCLMAVHLKEIRGERMQIKADAICILFVQVLLLSHDVSLSFYSRNITFSDCFSNHELTVFWHIYKNWYISKAFPKLFWLLSDRFLYLTVFWLKSDTYLTLIWLFYVTDSFLTDFWQIYDWFL